MFGLVVFSSLFSTVVVLCHFFTDHALAVFVVHLQIASSLCQYL